MGLAVSQVRLLALTNRKADIELQMQVNSKRKMMLTRKSTELAQLYHSKLQSSHIQYATSAGFEDVNYSYLMGETGTDGEYTGTFLHALATNSSNLVKKPENNMILTDQWGKVVVNDSLAKIIAATKDQYGDKTTAAQASYAIIKLIDEYKEKSPGDDADKFAIKFLFQKQLASEEYPNKIDPDKADLLSKNLQIMILNGGYKGSRNIYLSTKDPSVSLDQIPTPDVQFYESKDDAKNKRNPLTLEPGMCYTLYNENGYLLSEPRFYGVEDTAGNAGFAADLTLTETKYLSNLVSFFGATLSAAIQNGTTTEAEAFYEDNGLRSSVINETPNGNYQVQVGKKILAYGNAYNTYDTFNSNWDASTLESHFNSCVAAWNSYSAYDNTLPKENSYYALKAKDGMHYYKIEYDATTNQYKSPVKITADEYYSCTYQVKPNTDKEFRQAMNTECLQAGFRSGSYQLAMVVNTKHGIYHKNTTMNYFTHMNYVVEKTDSSDREEITAWFNAEQAEISNQETYWDTEIQNLSAELTSVNTEISSVKQLKSDNIKSVFNWGNS